MQPIQSLNVSPKTNRLAHRSVISRILSEALESNDSWKTPGSKGYDQSKAADALAAISQPLAWMQDPTREPFFVKDWVSPSGKVYRRGDKAPRWTENEVAAALLPEFKKWASRQQSKFSGYADTPTARSSKSEEAHGNMALELVRIMRANIDQGRDTANGYLGFIKARVMGAGAHGVGETLEDRAARGILGKLVTFKKESQADAAFAIANSVGPEFRTNDPTKKHEKSKRNPYGKWSSQIAEVAEEIGNALKTGQDVTPFLSKAEDLHSQIQEDPSTYGPGTSIGQINVPHMGGHEGAAKKEREQLLKMKMSSVDAAKENEEGKTTKNELADRNFRTYLDKINPEIVYNVLKMAREYAIPEQGQNEQVPIKSFMAKLQKTPNFLKRYPNLVPLSNLEYRYLLRILSDRLPKKRSKSGELGVNYPGKGFPGEDPELVDADNKTFDDPSAAPSTWAKENFPWLAMGEYYVVYDRASGQFVKHQIKDPEDVRRALGVRDGKAHVDTQIAHSMGVSINRINQIANGKGDAPGALQKFGDWLRYYEDTTGEAAVENKIDNIDRMIIKESIAFLKKIFTPEFHPVMLIG